MIKRSVAFLLGMGIFLGCYGCAAKSNGQTDVESVTPESESVTNVSETETVTEDESTEEATTEEPTYKKLVQGDFTLEWLVEDEFVRFKLRAPTTGWVALGIAPSSMMKDADFIMGYVEDGKVAISDEYGNSPTAHKPDTDLGGTDNVMDKSGWENDGVTQISFKIALSSGDSYDKVLEPGKAYKVLFAYGNGDDFTSYHKKKASAKIEAL